MPKVQKPSSKPAADAAEKPASTKRIIVPATEQGSVGKSFLLINLFQWFKSHPLKPKVAAFDPDFRKPSLKACHPEAELIDIRVPRQLDNLVTTLADADITLVDGMAGHFGFTFERWANEVRLFNIAQRIGATVTYFVVVDDSLENIECLDAVLKSAPPDVQLLVVQNYHKMPGGIGAGLPLARWDRSEVRRGFQKRGAIEIQLDRLDKDCMEFVEKFHHTPGKLAGDSNPAGLNLCDHQRFVSFTEHLYAQFDQAEHLLFPPAMLEIAAK